MRLSALQRHILRECYQYLPAGRQAPKNRVPRKVFTTFYKKKSAATSDNITVSLERLIDRGCLIGYGRRTPHKWFIEQVKLTPLGRRVAKASYGKQQQLPFRR